MLKNEAKKLNLLLLILIFLLDLNLTASDRKADETLARFIMNFSLAFFKKSL